MTSTTPNGRSPFWLRATRPSSKRERATVMPSSMWMPIKSMLAIQNSSPSVKAPRPAICPIQRTIPTNSICTPPSAERFLSRSDESLAGPDDKPMNFSPSFCHRFVIWIWSGVSFLRAESHEPDNEQMHNQALQAISALDEMSRQNTQVQRKSLVRLLPCSSDVAPDQGQWFLADGVSKKLPSGQLPDAPLAGREIVLLKAALQVAALGEAFLSRLRAAIIEWSG